MSDGVTFQSTTLATPPDATIVATDDAGAAGQVQIVKLAQSANGSATPVQADGDGLLVNPGATIGSLTEVSPATDTASSGLNGRLQRIAQRLTSLIALLVQFVTGGGTEATALRVTVASDSTGLLSVDDNGGSLTVDGLSTEMAGLSAGSLNADLVPSTDVNAYKWLSLQIIGTWSGQIQIQGSNDNTTFYLIPSWFSTSGVNASSTDQPQSLITSNRLAFAVVGYRYLRVRMTAYTSGTATGVLELYATPVPAWAAQYVNGVYPGSGSTALGKVEDALHASGDMGVFSLAVRNDNDAAFSGTDLDYTPFGVDSAGRVSLRPFSYNRLAADGQVKGSAGTLHTVTIAATGIVTAGVLTIYDSLTESGTVIFSFAIPTSLTAVSLTFDCPFATGLYVGYDATLANVQVTTSYR